MSQDNKRNKFRHCVVCGEGRKTRRVHRFPIPAATEPERAFAWAAFAYPNEQFDQSKLFQLSKAGKVLCSKHFEDRYYVDSANTRLCSTAYPTLMPPISSIPTIKPHLDHDYHEKSQIPDVTLQSDNVDKILQNFTDEPVLPVQNEKFEEKISQDSKTQQVSLTVKRVRKLTQNETKWLKVDSLPNVTKVVASSSDKNLFITEPVKIPLEKQRTDTELSKIKAQLEGARAFLKKRAAIIVEKEICILDLKKQVRALTYKLKRQQDKVAKINQEAVEKKLPKLPEIDRAKALTSAVSILTKDNSKYCSACLGLDDLKSMHTKKDDFRPLFYYVTSVQMTGKNNLAYLCQPCLAVCEYMYKFKEQCVQVDQKLKELQGHMIEQPDPYNDEILIQIQHLTKPDEAMDTTEAPETKTVLNEIINGWKCLRKPLIRLTIMKKYELIQEVDKKELPRRKIAQKYGIAYGSLINILENRRKIEFAVRQNCEKAKKHKQCPPVKYEKFAALESVIYDHFSPNAEDTTNKMWKEKAESVAQEMNIDDFVADRKWLINFKKRFNINTKIN